MLRYAYFPGCSSKSTSLEYHISCKKVAEKLGINLIELENSNCCGTHVMEDYNKKIWLALNARNLALAEEKKCDLATICSSCYLNSKKAKIILDNDEEKKREINQILKKINRKYYGNVKIKHILEILVKDYGIERLKEKVTMPLDIKAVPYYGCQIIRPPEITNFDDPENPSTFETLLDALGCEVISLPQRTECCGAPLTLIDQKLYHSMLKKLLNSLVQSNADCIVTLCPLCHHALDSGQIIFKLKRKIPVLHITQIIGLALGLSPKEIALDKNLVETKPLIKKSTY